MNEDAELLRRYASEKSEEAFAELVRQHLGFVYHTALRYLGDDVHGAEDVAQTVFADLARKAQSLAGRPVLAGWLHTSTRYAALQRRRAERRRQAHEQEAHVMQELTRDAEASANWERLRPIIDDALHALNSGDRDAVLMRFFEGRNFAEVGARLNLSEDGARLRVNRALDKLYALLAKRGVTSTVGALAIALAGQSASAAPTGLASTVTGAALGAQSGASVGIGGMFRTLGLWKIAAVLGGSLAAISIAGVLYFSASTPRPNPTVMVRTQGIDSKDQTIWMNNDGSISPSFAQLMDLDARELGDLKSLYQQMQVLLRATTDPTATVSRSTNKLVITYYFMPEELRNLEKMFKGRIEKILDARSNSAFASLDLDRIVSGALMEYPSSIMPKPESRMMTWARSVVGNGSGPNLQVVVTWSGSGSNTLYAYEVGYSALETDEPKRIPLDSILKRFFGDLVKTHRPEIMNEISPPVSLPTASK